MMEKKVKENSSDKNRDINRKPRRPIGNYIIAAILIVMVIFYLIYVNGFLG